MLQPNKTQTGYTLIELLLYVAIVGSLLTLGHLLFGMVAEARVKNQTVSEVDEQGTAIMDYMTQTIRNATSITTPTVGLNGPSLTLAVPTVGLSPTIFNTSGATTLGYSVDGTSTDTSNSNVTSATKFVASTSGTVSALYGLVGPTVAASPNNQAQMALYSGTSAPTTLLASSTSVTLTAGSWNTFTIAPVSVTSGQTYWLAYNTNGIVAADNNLRTHPGTTGQTMFASRTFGTWPASWSGATENTEFSTYALIDTGAAPPAVQVKEGAGALVPLTSNDVQVTNLSFKNLTRAGTGGIVQVSFTVSRVNPNNRNEYNYQKTFIGSAEVGW